MGNNPFDNFSDLGSFDNSYDEYSHPVESGTDIILPEEKDQRSGHFWYNFLIIIFGLILTIKLMDLQVVQGVKNQYLAEGNRIRSREITAPRGNIYDKSGEILAKSIASYDLELYPADLPKDKTERYKVYSVIEQNSHISVESLAGMIDSSGLFSLEPIILKENLDRDEALLLEVRYKDFNGISVTKIPTRQYSEVLGLSHVLGYVGKISQKEFDNNEGYNKSDYFGKSGVELTYEKDVKGKDGEQQVEVDSLGRFQKILATKQPVSGNNVYLTIDNGLQSEMAKDLNDMSNQLGGKEAVALAIDPQTGGILGSVSLPSYNNNIFSQNNFSQEYQKILDDPNKPLINRAINGLYPAGSTIKPVIAAAALEEKIITDKTTLDTSIGKIVIGDWVFPDWKTHGVTDVKKAIAESNDIFFYAIGGGYDKITGLGVDKIDNYLEKFGFGSKTGIDIPGESAGLVPTPPWKKKVKKESWYLGDTYHLSIGQGDLLVTPLQLINSISAIANGGKLYEPHVFLKETDSSGNKVKEFTNKIIREGFISNDNIKTVQEGMRQTVTSGSGRALNDLSVQAAGKTGTAQFGASGDTHSWFVSYAPYDNPKIALVVLIEGGGEGNVTAVPVSKQIMNYYFTRP